MAHLILLVYLALLISGTVTAVTLQARYQVSRDKVYRYLLGFILFSLCRVTSFILFYYVEINLADSPPGLDMALLRTWAHLPALAGMAGEMIMLGHVVCVLRWPWGHPRYARMARYLALVFALVLILTFTNRFVTGSDDLLVRLRQGMDWMILATMIGVPALLALASTDRSRRAGTTRGLGWMLMAGLYPMVVIPVSAGRSWAIADNLFMVYVHLVPLIWSRQRSDNAVQETIQTNPESTLSRWVREHRITSREGDLIRLILQGKSNKEIEYELGIAFSTVKNHLYNVYRKCGVNSRAQLIHRLLHDPDSRP